ncbi:hypothetical protein FBALC1_09782 [Flavobacteriales bacterium ALC-1]|nr:hypothetical protein FBALC1_09782 [Flavobacteriales bacterium ALC-1]
MNGKNNIGATESVSEQLESLKLMFSVSLNRVSSRLI